MVEKTSTLSSSELRDTAGNVLSQEKSNHDNFKLDAFPQQSHNFLLTIALSEDPPDGGLRAWLVILGVLFFFLE